jgi:hypothetical protein
MKAGIADTEKESIARQWHDKHVSAVENNNATINELLEAFFLCGPSPKLHKEKYGSKREVPASRGVMKEAGKCTLLRAVIKQRLVKSITY